MKMAKIWKESDKAKQIDSRIEKIGRDKANPAPGDYDHTGAWKKT